MVVDDVPSIIHHVSIGVEDLARAAAFYDKVMATIGARRVMEFPYAVAYGKTFPEMWIQVPFNGEPPGAPMVRRRRALD